MKDKYNSLRDFYNDYGDEHKCCPNCGSKNVSMTLVGFVFDFLNKPKEYVDKNNAKCQDCKWEGYVHDLISENDTKEIKSKKDANNFFVKSIQDCVTKGIHQAIASRNDEVLEMVNKSIVHYKNLLKNQNDFANERYKGALTALVALKEQLGFSLTDDEYNFIQTIK